MVSIIEAPTVERPSSFKVQEASASLPLRALQSYIYGGWAPDFGKEGSRNPFKLGVGGRSLLAVAGLWAYEGPISGRMRMLSPELHSIYPCTGPHQLSNF